ncbi:hypothetical protein BGZ80_010500 [Entomortierella chlamydospora]|uniref:Uncharacterized protein n=1 Tax=Entomortierella chlamydospora TaxID=101097 RepID=A0A9P6SZU4_9FUNG|nr:hypothetical protein BGZ79_010486 [Entomortierella chlamydospora]KAG0014340.1 hypothetical protein BGZ80_010500 [Entomortierella chlamydospora]
MEAFWNGLEEAESVSDILRAAFLIEPDYGPIARFVNAIYMHLVRLNELNPWPFGFDKKHCLRACSENIRKRSLWSAERNIPTAIDDLDENIGKKRRVLATGKENETAYPGPIDECKGRGY